MPSVAWATSSTTHQRGSDDDDQHGEDGSLNFPPTGTSEVRTIKNRKIVIAILDFVYVTNKFENKGDLASGEVQRSLITDQERSGLAYRRGGGKKYMKVFENNAGQGVLCSRPMPLYR